METIPKMPEIKLSDIYSIYVGKPNRCMCGCSGKFTYAKKYQEYSTKDRGYQVTDDEINDARIKRVFNKMKKFAENVEVIRGEIYTAIIGKTQYTIYLTRRDD